VISNFNLDPYYLVEYAKSYTIYDQSNKSEFIRYFQKKKDGNLIFSKHVGHNVIDHLRFIVENYDDLPKLICLLKGNIVSKYMNLDDFKKLINNDYYTFLFTTREYVGSTHSGNLIHPGMLIEKNDNGYVWNSPHRYFTHLNQMLDFLFVDPVFSDFVIFSPGGGYTVERERILQYPISFWQGLILILDYDFFPCESYIVERLMHTFFDANYQLKEYCYDINRFKLEISRLPNRSSEKQPYKIRLKHKLMKNKVK